MVEECGYENCGPMVDFLVGGDFKIRLEAHTEKNNLFLVIPISFEKSPKGLEVHLSRVTGALDGYSLPVPRIFTCSYTMWDLNYLRNSPQLSDPQSIPQARGCFLLFFDSVIPKTFGAVILNFNNAIEVDNKPVELPFVRFKRNKN